MSSHGASAWLLIAAFLWCLYLTMRSFHYGRQKGGFVKGWFWRTYPRSGFRSGDHANVPSFRFSFRGNIRMYPRSGFRSGGTSAKTTLLENHSFANPPKNWYFYVEHLFRIATSVANCQYLTLKDPKRRYLTLIDAIPFHKKAP